MFEPTSVYSVATPMFYVCKVFGLAPFRMRKEFDKCSLNMIWSITLMVSIFTYTMIFMKERPVMNTSVLVRVPEIVNSYLSPLSMFFDILFECLFSNKILGVLSSMNAFDEDFRSYFGQNLKREHRSGQIWLVIGLAATVVHLSLSIAFTAVISTNSSLYYFLQSCLLYVLPTIVNAFVGFQCFVLILLLKQRFAWLNRRLASVSRDFAGEASSKPEPDKKGESRDPLTLFQGNKASPILEKIRSKHYQLCLISYEINTAYSMQILLLVFKNFVTIITGLFYCGRHLMYTGYITLNYLVYTIIQLSLAVVQIVGLTVACSSASAEAQKTGSLIHNTKTFQDQSKEELKLQVTFFSLQLLHQNVEFTACRIFVVNESLLLTIVGAVSTYLVIVIQFQMGDIRNKSQ